MRHSTKDLQGELTVDRFRNQFLLGPEFVDELSGWQQFDIAPAFKLMAHPEIDVAQVIAGRQSITLIGFILDPENPQRNNAEVLNTLLATFSTPDKLIAATAGFGGRWIIIACDGEHTIIFNDALGLRQVFYTVPGCRHGHWVMSQPGLLAWLKKLEPGSAALGFIDSHEIRTHAEYRWPAAATAFGEIKHLLPNHLLDLSTGQHRRYWPLAPLVERGLDEVVSETIGILQGLMTAADQRFDLALGITAGYDSRIVLAASRGIKNNLSPITVRNGHLPDTHPDLLIPAQLLGKLGLRHELIKAMPYMSASFSKAFKENVFLAHDYYGTSAEAVLNHFGRKKVVVTGSGAEVAREPFRKRIAPDKRHYTARDLAQLQWMGDNPFALQSFQQWLDGYDDSYNVHLLDLFSWEQSHGCWLAATHTEFDYAWQDLFTPFNCRALLVGLLSVNECYRNSPDHKLFRLLIEKMWPELLSEPINPHFNSRKRGVFIRVLRKLVSGVNNRGGYTS